MSSLRLFVSLSVCDVGGSESHRLEILETNCTNNSPTPSVFVAQRPSTYSQGNMGKFGETRAGVGKTQLGLTLASPTL